MADTPKPILTNDAYDTVKKTVLVVLPLLGSLYFGLSAIWGFPAVEQVLGSIAVLSTVLGGTVEVSRKRFEESDLGLDGQFVVKQDGGGASDFALVLEKDPEVLADKARITFRVVQTRAD